MSSQYINNYKGYGGDGGPKAKYMHNIVRRDPIYEEQFIIVYVSCMGVCGSFGPL